MPYSTMVGWIEIADERRFRENAMSDRMPEIDERQYLHLGSAILSLPCRIIEALSQHRTSHRADS
jgi:hypothetical protein